MFWSLRLPEISFLQMKTYIGSHQLDDHWAVTASGVGARDYREDRKSAGPSRPSIAQDGPSNQSYLVLQHYGTVRSMRVAQL
ncbi:hypothetical protein RRG08_004851 [Elysia crispata]|uniref:Uncharacterized protein n=1 Tax=Elysia crispata TaxID=231223 RepID=A0AAE1E5Y2_9GAST|nr:hypothetical protein RRG08_004851 [Elysia crispata]